MGSKFGSDNPEYNTSSELAYEAQNSLRNSIDKYTGNTGYQNSLSQGRVGADIMSQGAANKAAATAKSSGLSAASAARAGSDSAANGYYDAFGQQQGAAFQSGLNNVQGNNSLVQNYNQLSQLALQHKKDTYGYAWNNMRFALSTVGSLLSGAGNIGIGGIGGAAGGAAAVG
jgi:hypothetical protein